MLTPTIYGLRLPLLRSGEKAGCKRGLTADREGILAASLFLPTNLQNSSFIANCNWRAGKVEVMLPNAELLMLLLGA